MKPPRFDSRPEERPAPGIGTTGEPVVTWPVILIATVVAVAGILATAALSRATGAPLPSLTRDPATVTGSPAYTGFLSNLGAILWSAASAAGFLGTLSLRGVPGRREDVRFLLASGLLTMLLGLDDVFLLHEDILTGAGIPERATYGAYAILVAAYFLAFFRRHLSGGLPLLLMALTLFGLSVGIDQSLPYDEMVIFVEDGLKTAGIVFWAAYLWNAVIRSLNANLDPDSYPSPPV